MSTAVAYLAAAVGFFETVRAGIAGLGPGVGL